MRSQIAPAAVVLLGLLGLGLNLAYAGMHLQSFLLPETTAQEREVLLSAIAGSVGFALVMAWMALRPLERKILLLIAAVPMVVGNLLHSLIYLQAHPEGMGHVLVNLTAGLGYAGVHVAVYFLAKREPLMSARR